MVPNKLQGERLWSGLQNSSYPFRGAFVLGRESELGDVLAIMLGWSMRLFGVDVENLWHG